MIDDPWRPAESEDPEAQARRWLPVVGMETQRFLEGVPGASCDEVREAAMSILSRGVSPDETAGQETGLVVGYVQSGKTMSFETVAALARDNGFQVVIIVAGISTSLLEQSTRRVRRDFRLDESGCPRKWIHFQNPEDEEATVVAVRDALEDWRDAATLEEERRTVLVTVLKHHGRLAKLNQLLRKVGMDGVPALVIDDEADQASLNIDVSQESESTTYRRLIGLRRALPLHTYLQYTATPQAPLLISIVDSLSPNFVEVLRPGSAYVGGREFFADNENVTKIIPVRDVPANRDSVLDAPTSLVEALRVFMVGVTVGVMEGEDQGNRSMLVHPSHLTALHHEYYKWLHDIFQEWKRIFALEDSDCDKQELIEEMRVAYDDLAKTVGSEMPGFRRLREKFWPAFRRTRLLKINASDGPTPAVDWNSTYGWILVGGQALDRGFTVKGLTVTYMPRGIGVGNADTVQQRARFFGYKRDYFGLCRVYLDDDTRDAFRQYVEHEEEMRHQLEGIRDKSVPLNDWKRAFILDRALRPCRQNVLKFGYVRGEFSDAWVMPREILGSETVRTENRQTVAAFLDNTPCVPNDGHPERTPTQRHQVAKGLSLRDVMARLLIPMRITALQDSQRFTGLFLQLSRALEKDPNETCTIYRMSPETGRERRINSSGEIINLFQGQAPVEPLARRGEVYPGDRKIRNEGEVTVQIHMLDVTGDEAPEDGKVAVLAVWVPARLAVGWIGQYQPDQRR